MLSLLIAIPFIGGLALLLVPEENKALLKQIAVGIAVLPLLVALWLWMMFDPGNQSFQFVEQFNWVPSLGIRYYLGMDGISLALVLLTALVFLLAVIASFGINTRTKEYFALFFILEAAVFGVFLALDYILFYVFWEVVLIPMYFLIAIWGGARREYAALKFFIYTMVGSLLMLVAIVALYLGTGMNSFGIPEIAEAAKGIPGNVQMWVLLAFFLGFGVKVPVFPFHTWLPDAHVEAPTPISAILAAILLKMGTYAFVRIAMPTLPDAWEAFAWTLAAIGIVNIIYGGLAALVQKDMKKLVAYSSINHMGFVMLALAANTVMTINAAVFQMISHGLISAMLFLMVGVFYDRTHTRELIRLGGFFVTTPVAATILTIAAFANLGLPGMSGFIAEFFTLTGVMAVESMRVFVYFAAVGLVITAAFNLVLLYKVLMGEPKKEWQGLPDIHARELWTVVPLAVLTILFGLFPSLLINLINEPIIGLVALMGGM